MITKLGALDMLVNVSPLVVGKQNYLVTSMRDLSAEKRREVLERIFFHDVANTAGGIRAIADLLVLGDEPEVEEEYKGDLCEMSEQICEEIIAQRQLVAAERGDLQPNLSRSACASWSSPSPPSTATTASPRAASCRWTRSPTSCSAPTGFLLKRVLGNLLKNALEATPEEGVVTLGAETRGGSVVFRVHNPTVMPGDVKKQVFQRSFSTKAGSGRGVGTYSIKLLTEGYLSGQVAFTSQEPDGTTFTVTLPWTK